MRHLLNLVMIFSMMVVMDYRFTANAIHEILGVFIVLLWIVHHRLNYRWYTLVFNGKMNILRIFSTITNFLLLAMMLVVIVTGVLISQTLFVRFAWNGGILAHQLHTFASYAGFILIGVHLGFHWQEIWNKLCILFSINRTRLGYILFSRIIPMVIVVYGVYASFTRNIGSKLLFQHVFNDWKVEPTLISFVLDYMSIMGCYTVITYGVKRLLQSNSKKKCKV